MARSASPPRAWSPAKIRAAAAGPAVRASDGVYYGLDASAVARACAGADLFLNVSGACWLRDEYRTARVAAYLDSDPCYSQAKLAAVDAGETDPEVVRSAELIRNEITKHHTMLGHVLNQMRKVS